MHRPKQKQEEKKSAEAEGQLVDKKISDLCLQIRESRSKLDDYVGVISNHVGQIVSHRLSKFVALHSQIILEKDHEIKALEEHNQQVKQSQTGCNFEKLTKNIANLEAEIQRINTIKEMFRKEAEKLKIELDIKQKELDACKKREKQLIRQIWVLEEDIKDIYQADPVTKPPPELQRPTPSFKSTTTNQYCTPRRQRESPSRNMRASNRIISTEPTEIEREKLQSQLEDKYTGYKADLHLGVTKLKEKFSISNQEKRKSAFKSNTPSIRASNVRHSVARPIVFTQLNDNIYDDLRANLRKASRMKGDTNAEGWNSEEERALRVDDFRAICLYGPKIMQQVEGLVIDKYGQLREIDETSMQLLHNLFKNQNAIKILQIVFFSYSLEAITHINEHKRQLTDEIAYNEPSIQGQDPPAIITAKPKRVKMQKQLRKKFKNSFIHKTTDVYSQRSQQ